MTALAAVTRTSQAGGGDPADCGRSVMPHLYTAVMPETIRALKAGRDHAPDAM